MNELTITDELKGIDKNKARQIEKVFAPMVQMLKEFEGQFDQVMDLEQSPEKCVKAKRLRLDISKVRIEADKVRKVNKEEYLRAGNAIQGVYNILKFAVTDKEEALKEVETFYARIEEEKNKVRQAEREAELSKYGVDGSTIDLGGMDDTVWDNFLAGSKANHEAVQEAERKAKEERLEKEQADWEERKRERAENEKLRKKQKILQKELDKKAAQERAAEKEKADAERAEKEAQRLAAEAPDREKLAGWADALESKIGTLSTDSAKAAARQAVAILIQAAEGLAA